MQASLEALFSTTLNGAGIQNHMQQQQQQQTGNQSKKRGLESEVMDLMTDVKRGRLSSDSEESKPVFTNIITTCLAHRSLCISAGRRLDNFGELLFSGSNGSVEPGLSLSSGSESSSSPPEHNEGSPPAHMSVPDLHKPDLDHFNDFLVGIGREYDVDGTGGGLHFSAPERPADDLNSFLHDGHTNHAAAQTPGASSSSSSSLYPSLSSSTSAFPGTSPFDASSMSLYPSLNGFSDFVSQHNSQQKHGNSQLPPATISGDFAPQPTYRKADRLMAAPPPSTASSSSQSFRHRRQSSMVTDSETDDNVEDQASDVTRTTSSIRSTFSPTPPSSVSNVGEGDERDADVSLPAICPDHEQSHSLPPLRSVPALQQALGLQDGGSKSMARPSSAATHEKVARITSGVHDLKLRPAESSTSSTPRTHSLEDDEAALDSYLPHKRSRTRTNSLAEAALQASSIRTHVVDEDTRQRRLQVLKALAILSNHLFRLSMLPRSDVGPVTTPKAEVPEPPSLSSAAAA